MIGFDIGGTKCAAVLGNLGEEVEILDKITFPTAGKTPDEILGLFSDFIASKQKNYNIDGMQVLMVDLPTAEEVYSRIATTKEGVKQYKNQQLSVNL